MKPARFPGRRAVAAAVAAFLVASGPQALAERADKEKPAVINADTGGGDDINQTQIWTGNVVLTKGTIILRADQLTTKQDPEGYNLGVAIVTQPGKLAYFKQKREGVDEYIEGQAERIEYDEKADAVRLFNRAIVRRLAAGREADEIRGDRIDYNTRTEIYDAQSGGQQAAGGRVRAVLQPKIKPGASPVPGSGQTPAPTSTPKGASGVDAGVSRTAPSPGLELKGQAGLETPPRP